MQSKHKRPTPNRAHHVFNIALCQYKYRFFRILEKWISPEVIKKQRFGENHRLFKAGLTTISKFSVKFY